MVPNSAAFFAFSEGSNFSGPCCTFHVVLVNLVFRDLDKNVVVNPFV